MSKKAFDKIMRGLKEAQAHMGGEREGYKVTVPPTTRAEADLARAYSPQEPTYTVT